MKEDELISYYITKSIFNCSVKMWKHTGAPVHSAVTYLYFKMFNSDAANSSVSFSTSPEMSVREPEFDFSPRKMPALMGWSCKELKLFGTRVHALSWAKTGAAVHCWGMTPSPTEAGLQEEPPSRQPAECCCCLPSLLSSSSFFEPGMSRDGRNRLQTV